MSARWCLTTYFSIILCSGVISGSISVKNPMPPIRGSTVQFCEETKHNRFLFVWFVEILLECFGILLSSGPSLEKQLWSMTQNTKINNDKKQHENTNVNEGAMNIWNEIQVDSIYVPATTFGWYSSTRLQTKNNQITLHPFWSKNTALTAKERLTTDSLPAKAFSSNQKKNGMKVKIRSMWCDVGRSKHG